MPRIGDTRQVTQFRGYSARSGRDAGVLMEPLGFYVWQGASGRAFTHAVYTLIGCPAPLAASYVLVRRGLNGKRRVLAVGRTLSAAASLNLAHIRRKGATLGANEVHLHALAETEQDRAAAAFDIAAAENILGAPANCGNPCP